MRGMAGPAGLLVLSVALVGCGGSSPPSATPIPPPVLTSPSPSPEAGLFQLSPLPSPSPSPAAAAQSYTVAAGDTLAIIAQRLYGDANLWRRIYDANRATIGDNPDALRVGAVLSVPPPP